MNSSTTSVSKKWPTWIMSVLAMPRSVGANAKRRVANASATVPLIISLNSSNATAVLDGTLSSDADNDPLQFQWLQSNATIASGIVEGFTRDGVNRWRSIPYARPPVGRLRFRAPQPAQAPSRGPPRALGRTKNVRPTARCTATIALQAAADPPLPELVWYVDGRPWRVVPRPFTVRWPLRPGAHSFQVRVPGQDAASPLIRVSVH